MARETIKQLPEGWDPRDRRAAETIARYAEYPNRLPPILLSQSEDLELDLLPCDGLSRLRAWDEVGWDEIPCRRVQVHSRKDFFALAVQSNTTHGQPLTLEERKRAARNLFDQRMGKGNIASIVGRSIRTVRGWLRAYKEERKQEDRRKARELSEQGLSFREIGEQLGRHHTTISRWLSDGADRQPCQNAPDQDGDTSEDIHGESQDQGSDGKECKSHEMGVCRDLSKKINRAAATVAAAREALKGAGEAGWTPGGTGKLAAEVKELVSLLSDLGVGAVAPEAQAAADAPSGPDPGRWGGAGQLDMFSASVEEKPARSTSHKNVGSTA